MNGSRNDNKIISEIGHVHWKLFPHSEISITREMVCLWRYNHGPSITPSTSLSTSSTGTLRSQGRQTMRRRGLPRELSVSRFLALSLFSLNTSTFILVSTKSRCIFAETIQFLTLTPTTIECAISTIDRWTNDFPAFQQFLEQLKNCDIRFLHSTIPAGKMPRNHAYAIRTLGKGLKDNTYMNHEKGGNCAGSEELNFFKTESYNMREKNGGYNWKRSWSSVVTFMNVYRCSTNGTRIFHPLEGALQAARRPHGCCFSSRLLAALLA